MDHLEFRSRACDALADLQRGVVVVIFRYYEQLKKDGVTFTLEEPEVFQLALKGRHCATVLGALAEEGNQVFVSSRPTCQTCCALRSKC